MYISMRMWSMKTSVKFDILGDLVMLIIYCTLLRYAIVRMIYTCLLMTVSGLCEASYQVLAPRWTHWWYLWRPTSCGQVSTDEILRVTICNHGSTNWTSGQLCSLRAVGAILSVCKCGYFWSVWINITVYNRERVCIFLPLTFTVW